MKLYRRLNATQSKDFWIKVCVNPYFFIIMYFILRTPNTRTGLNDLFEFRQTQTAWGIREVEEHGLNLFHLPLPILGKPFQVPFEFPIFQNIAGLIGHFFSLSPSTAGRLTSLIFYCLSAMMLVVLSRRVLPNSRIELFLPLLLLTPYALEWSDACLIESTAIFFLLAFLIFLNEYLVKGSWYFLMLCSPALAFAALIKITTAIPLAVVFSAFLIVHRRQTRKLLNNILIFVVLSFSLLPTLLWTEFADHVKRLSVWTNWLTSAALTTWNFGTPASRVVFKNWAAIGARIWILGGFATLFSLYFLWKSRKNFSAWLLFLAVISPIMTFFNLYVVHDYYYLAIIFFLIFSFDFYATIQIKRLRIEVMLGFIVASLILSWAIQIPQRNYVDALTSSRSSVPELSQIIANNTKPSDEVMVVGCDWDPTVLYFANRNGIAAPVADGDLKAVLTKLYESSNRDEIGYIATCSDVEISPHLAHYQLKKIAPQLYKLEIQ